MTDAELEAVKIPKIGGGKSHSRYPHSKSQYPPGGRGHLNFEKVPPGKFSPEAEAAKKKIEDGFNSRPNVGKKEQDRESEL